MWTTNQHMQTRDVELMLAKCWANVYDAGSAFSQQWLNASCLLELTPVLLSAQTKHGEKSGDRFFVFEIIWGVGREIWMAERKRTLVLSKK